MRPESGVSVVSTSQLLEQISSQLQCIHWTCIGEPPKKSPVGEPFEGFLLGHGDEAHVVLGVAACFRVTNDVNGILLSLQSRG